MKLVSFWREERIRLGFLLGSEILEPGLADSFLGPGEDQFFLDAISFIRGGEVALTAARRMLANRPPSALHPVNSVKFAAPISPSTILCAGSNYREHNDEKASSPTSGRGAAILFKNVR